MIFIIYFPQTAYQSLIDYFNLCLYKLFKLKPKVVDKDEEENEEKIMSEFETSFEKLLVEKLHSYELFTVQSRIYDK